MPHNEDLDRLVSLAEAVADREAWQLFATYLALRGRGRRVEALRALDTFLNDAENWPFAERQALLLWLAAANADGGFGNLLIPQPLWQRVVAPTASAWLAREPDSARANYLYAIHVAGAEEGAEPLAYLRKAVRLDPADQTARATFIRRVAACTQNAQHELPWHGYLGVASEDIRDLRDALAMVEGIDDPASRAEFTPALTALLDTAEAWEAFQELGDGTDFASWCVDRGGPTGMLP
ncbi:MAG: hypothetical protein JWM65_3018 [Sphingomonas bacterium]|nr:hypothetical protein [Sphingomonas bacterium]